MVHATGLLEALVDVFAESVRALDDDRSTHEVMCRGVAVAIGATVSAFVRLNAPTQRCTVTCWYQYEHAMALRFVTNEPMTDERVHPGDAGAGARMWHQSLAFGILKDLLGQVEYAELPLGMHPTETRLAVFARPDRFSHDDFELLRFCAGPLGAVDRHLHLLDDGRTAPAERSGQADSAGLTRRELEVLALLSQGLMARSIGLSLGVSPRTVNKHLGNVYRKLDAHDRLVAVKKAQDFGILPAGIR
ncbi:helix-turn-helix transcriptional regulator [Nocardioides zhouii]|uniref:LuxR family transcriptional regulator n=1 Tax=Nocardioides zhouii TaxID=1168729 RepID=A0A4Q2SFC8_9ACTN|nr:helix-turn-helix transcriptional regulator [Nocardioides zhouii]RYC03822.1 LuxR family transcriptional regulator [Nocardioides zhouii]